jgi:hypothetical protein
LKFGGKQMKKDWKKTEEYLGAGVIGEIKEHAKRWYKASVVVFAVLVVTNFAWIFRRK